MNLAAAEREWASHAATVAVMLSGGRALVQATNPLGPVRITCEGSGETYTAKIEDADRETIRKALAGALIRRVA